MEFLQIQLKRILGLHARCLFGPGTTKLVAQSWYPRQLLAADLAILESTLYYRTVGTFFTKLEQTHAKKILKVQGGS